MLSESWLSTSEHSGEDQKKSALERAEDDQEKSESSPLGLTLWASAFKQWKHVQSEYMPRVFVNFMRDTPMPKLMTAVLALVCQYFVMQTLWSGAHCYQWLTGAGQRFLASLDAATDPVIYAPMLCTLFLAPWFRAMRLTSSLDPLQYALPQLWLEGGMVICSAVLILKSMLHFFGTYLEIGMVPKSTKGASDPRRSLMRTLCCGVHLIMNIMVACTLFGTFLMHLPYDSSSTQPEEEFKKITTQNFDSLLLATQYFTVQLIVQIQTGANYAEESESTSILVSAQKMTRLVPMLCLLFQATGLHALEQDPPAGQPPNKVRTAMDIAAYALFAFVALQIILWLQRMASDDAYHISRWRQLSALKFCLRVIIFVASFFICAAIWADPRFYKRKRNKDAVENPMDRYDVDSLASDMVQSVVLIATLYFSGNFITWVAETFVDTPRTRHISAAVLKSLEMCPMVTVLIVVLRLRSLQLGAGLGEPEAIAETCMYMVFMGLFGRLLCTTLEAANGTSAKEDSNTVEDSKQNACTSMTTKVLRIAHLACTLLVYFSVFRMLVGCIVMGKSNMQELERPFGQFRRTTTVAPATG
jgi:hypothetical protein